MVQLPLQTDFRVTESKLRTRPSQGLTFHSRVKSSFQSQEHHKQQHSSFRPQASKGTQVSTNLLTVLKDELKYEKESYRKDEGLLDEPPHGFLLDDTLGENIFYLDKVYNNERIRIEVSIDEQDIDTDEDEDEGDDEGDEYELQAPVTFKVLIRKGNQELQFECESDGGYLTINHLFFKSEGMFEDSTNAYTGPVFEDLDDTLQQAFVDYLEERGITADLGEYIRAYVTDKASVEYVNWLSRVKEFVAS